MKRQVCLLWALTWWSVAGAAASDWPSWRGPEQNGTTRETAVVKSWSLDGENLLWKVSVGGRTTPVLMDGRLYAITPAGKGESLQERVVCLDADTGKMLWEHRFNVFHTDIVEARLGWTAVVGDPQTGNVYAHGTGGEFFCFSRDGEVLWKTSLGEVFGRYNGYGGRLHTPIVDGDHVIISYVYILSNWGTGKAKSGHRYVAFDKRTGEVQWWSQPGGKPLDTTYSVPAVHNVDGKRQLIGGNADGGAYGMLASNGQRLWSMPLSKRGINTSVVVDGNYAYFAHSEENLDTTAMGRIVCLDVSKSGDLSKGGEVWRMDGVTVGYSSPALANGRLYAVTNSANLLCLDAKTGKQHWEYKLGRVMKGSPVVTADGVIYAGTVNGRFMILQDAGETCELLDEKEFTRPDDAVVEINGSPIVANGRVYFMTAYDTYCLGRKGTEPQPVKPPSEGALAAADLSKPVVLQIVPMDVVLAPGERVTFATRLFDANGQGIGSPEATWSIDGVRGTFSSPGTFVAATDNAFSAGVVKASANGLSAEARVRVAAALPIHETFDAMPVGQQPPGWVGLDLKTQLVEMDGGVVLKKLAKSPSAPYSRMRAFSGPPLPAGYTVEVDLMAQPKKGRRPTLSDMGLINDRYKMIMLGYEKQLRLVTYSPIPRLQKEVPFDWQADTWYRGKLRVEVAGGKALVRCKVWPRGEAEPAGWMVEMVDACPNLEGSPGLYAYSKGTTASKEGSEVFFDNYQVYPND